jgi:branched-chain amino acid transport system ATP-binding protein
MPFLELEGVTASYGPRRAIESVSLGVERGEIVTLLGANGAGKSTILRAISGLVRPVSGRIVYDGQDLTTWPADAIVAAGIAHVPEGRLVFPAFTVLDNLLIGAHTVPPRDVPGALERAFTIFPALRERRHQPAGTLSGGEQQMLVIARGLMARPKLLLLDEPSLGLAPLLAREIFRVIARLNGDGVSVLLVEQNARRALRLASRGYVLETGRIVATGSSRALSDDPVIQKAYLGSRANPGAPAGDGGMG